MKHSLKELMKPWTCTCLRCGGTLHVIPYEKKIGKGKFMLASMNLCKCTFTKLKEVTP